MEFVTDLAGWCPVTKLYRADDGQHYAVTCARFFTARYTEAYLADENGIAIDADGAPATELHALIHWDDELDHDEAVARLTAWLADNSETAQ